MIQCNRFLCMEERRICVSVQLRAQMACRKSLPGYKNGADCHSVSIINSNAFSAIFFFRGRVFEKQLSQVQLKEKGIS